MKIVYAFPIDLSIVSPPQTASYSTVCIGRDQNKYQKVLYSFFQDCGFVFGFSLEGGDNVFSAANNLAELLSPENMQVLLNADPLDEYDKVNAYGAVNQIQLILKEKQQ